MIKKIDPFVDDEKKIGYQCGPVYYYEAKAGSILADHSHGNAETLWIMEGRGKILIEDKIELFQAPCIIEISPNVYHKFMPETDVNFIEQRHKTGNT